MRRCFGFNLSAGSALLLLSRSLPALVVARSAARSRLRGEERRHPRRALPKSHNVSVEALREANKLDRNDPIKVGQTLSIPAPETVALRLGCAPGKPVRPGVVRLVRGNETLQTRVLDRRRHLVENTLPEFTRFLRFPDGATHPIDARLVTLVGMVSDHFGGRTSWW